MDISGLTGNAGYVPFMERSAVPGPEAGGFSRMLEQAKAEGPGGIPAAGSKTIDRKSLNAVEKKLYEACQTLETFIIKNMLNGMRKTVMKSKLIDTGFAGELYEDMLWDEYAKEYTKKAGFGFAEQAYLELSGKRGFRFVDGPA